MVKGCFPKEPEGVCAVHSLIGHTVHSLTGQLWRGPVLNGAGWSVKGGRESKISVVFSMIAAAAVAVC